MKSKFTDNKLAEEWDVIVLTDNSHIRRGLPCGSLGTLIHAYTGKETPLYAEFAVGDGTCIEEALSLYDFRVLNERDRRDLPLIARFYKARFCLTATLAASTASGVSAQQLTSKKVGSSEK